MCADSTAQFPDTRALHSLLKPFFGAAEDMVAEQGPGAETFTRVGALLRPLAADPNLIDPSRLAALHDSGAGFSILGHGDAGSTLMLARFRLRLCLGGDACPCN